MIDHISLGVKHVARSKTFYNAALEALGYASLGADDTSLSYGKDRVKLYINASTRPVTPDMESGLHVCFTATSRKRVDDFHAAALAAGGQDNGGPGLREDYGPDYYAAYVIDPDGYRLEAYCSRPS